MSQNCKSTYPAVARDANNNTLYTGGGAGFGQAHGYGGGRRYTPPVTGKGDYQQVTAKVLFGSVSAINDLKLQDKVEARRTH